LSGPGRSPPVGSLSDRAADLPRGGSRRCECASAPGAAVGRGPLTPPPGGDEGGAGGGARIGRRKPPGRERTKGISGLRLGCPLERYGGRSGSPGWRPKLHTRTSQRASPELPSRMRMRLPPAARGSNLMPRTTFGHSCRARAAGAAAGGSAAAGPMGESAEGGAAAAQPRRGRLVAERVCPLLRVAVDRGASGRGAGGRGAAGRPRR
jgi:hypothetical protein